MTNPESQKLRYPFPEAPEFGELIEVADRVLWMRLPLPMALDHVNVYILDDGDSWTIVDTGFDTKKTRAMWRAVLESELSAKPVGRIIVTHHHPDHIGLAGWFQSEFGAQLVTTRTAWLYARMLVLDNQPQTADETIEFWKSAGMDRSVLAKRLEARPFNYADVVAPMPLGFVRIREGDLLHSAGREWDVRIGNGHSPEHATLWDRNGELVIGGDQLLPSISPNLGVYATEPDADPVAEWLEACERLHGHATHDQLVLPGHKLPFRGLPRRLTQLIDNHHGALARLSRFLERPATAVDCFDVLFKRKIGEGEYGLALVEAMAHVNHLFEAGLATRQRREDGAWLWQAKEQK